MWSSRKNCDFGHIKNWIFTNNECWQLILQDKVSLSWCFIKRILNFTQVLYRKFKLVWRINVTKDYFEENSSFSNKYWTKHEGMYFFVLTLHISINISYIWCCSGTSVFSDGWKCKKSHKSKSRHSYAYERFFHKYLEYLFLYVYLI